MRDVFVAGDRKYGDVTHEIRAGIFASVSTDEQATPGHVSIDKQIEVCREYMSRMGIVESCQPFVADGYSRSFYEGLSEARADIPSLDAAMRAAASNQFDVLFLYYFDRLRTLAYPVFIHLGKVRKQLRSVSEPTPIVPPDLYDFAKDTITATMIHLHGIKNDAQIGRLITQRKEAMPGRIQRGLPPGRIPFGYKHINSKTPPGQIPEKIELLIQGGAMLLAGEPYIKIGEVLGVHYGQVENIYTNPFYSGEVVYNKTYVQRIGTKKMYIPLPRSKWTIGKGQHEPVFTHVEMDEFRMELERRSRGETRRTLWNKLLVCDVCGGRLHNAPSKQRLTCIRGGKDHVLLQYPPFYDMAIDAIAEELRREETGESRDDDEQKRTMLMDKLSDKQKRRKLIQEGYEASLYTTVEAQRLMGSIEEEIANITKELERLMMDRQSQRQAERVMTTVDWQHAREFFEASDPFTINRLLTAWLKELRVGMDRVVVVKK